MGHEGNQKHPDVIAAIDGAITKIARSKVAAGLMTIPVEDQRKYAALGARYLTTQIAAVIGGGTEEHGERNARNPIGQREEAQLAA